MIKSFGQMQNTLSNYKVEGWAKNVELGNKIDFGKLEETGKTKSFGDFLAQSIGNVNKMQQNADVAVQELASGKSQNLHETLLAVEKADIAFKTMNQIRTKVIDAYKEIMRMQV